MITKIKLIFLRMWWRKKNKHNNTVAVNDFDCNCVAVGKCTYGGIYALTHNKEAKLTIGNYCSIAPNVAFVLSSDHPICQISTYPFKVKIMGEDLEGLSKGDIVVDDDVWIGLGSIILSGVHIGQGAVIAAGSVVTKDVPPYAIVGGVPARIIKYRFPENLRTQLEKIDFSRLTEDMIRENIAKLYDAINSDTDLSWLPQKSADNITNEEMKKSNAER